MPNKIAGVLLLLLSLWSTKFHAQTLQIKIEGTTEFETRTIDSIGYAKRFDDYQGLKKELDSTLIKLDKIGYLNKELEYFGKNSDSTYRAIIKLNDKIKYVRVFYGHVKENNKIRSALRISNTEFFDIELSKLEETLDFLVGQIAKDGDPFIELRLTDFKAIDNSIISTYLISKASSKRTIDKIVLKGYDKFPESFLNYLINIKEGQTLDIDLIKKKTKAINQLQFAKQSRDPELLFTNDSTLLYIYVEKRSNNSFDGFLGFGTDEDTNKLQLDGFLNLQLHNNLHYGERLNIYYKSDESEQKTFDVKLSMPYILGLPLGVKSQLNIFKKDSSFLTTTQNIALNYQISPASNTSIGYSSIKSDDLLDTSNENINTFSSKFVEASYYYSDVNLDDPLYPIEFLIDLTFGLGSRNSNNADQNQSKGQLEAFKLFYLNERNSIFGRLTGGVLFSNDYYDNELLRFGGINSIRGFKENSIAANLLAVLNTEYRYRLSSNFYVHTVLDAAYFENELTEIREKLFGFGFGFGLFTRSGLLKFNYSGSRVGNETVKLSDFKIHISLSANF